MSMEIKRMLYDSVVVPVLTYGSEAWNMQENKSRIRAVEMSYLKGACGMTLWNRLTNEEVKQ